MSNELFVLRLWDMFDGWIDVGEPMTAEAAHKLWLEKTHNGTRNTKYADGDYWRVFPANTQMLVTPEFLGR